MSKRKDAKALAAGSHSPFRPFAHAWRTLHAMSEELALHGHYLAHEVGELAGVSGIAWASGPGVDTSDHHTRLGFLGSTATSISPKRWWSTNWRIEVSPLETLVASLEVCVRVSVRNGRFSRRTSGHPRAANRANALEQS